MKRIIAACALLMVLAACASPPPAPATAAPPVPSDQALRADLRSFMEQQAGNLSFSGSVLVARRGTILLQEGYGLADRVTKLPNTEQTTFRIGSITKEFTATAILLLQAQGQLDTTDRLCSHLQDCPPAWDAITLRELLTHTSGLHEFKDLPDYPEFRATPVAPTALMGRLTDIPLDFPPVEKWQYTNSGYVLLGLVIERVSGLPYEDFVAQNILAPLHMTHTGYFEPPGLALGYADSYTVTPAAHADATVEYAAGGLYSTVGDLYLWDEAMAAGQVLPSTLRETMLRPYQSVPNSGGLSYGYGVFVGSMDGHAVVLHTGLLEGYSSMNMHFPDEDVAVILLGNQRNPQVTGIGRHLTSMVFDAVP